MIGAEDVDVQYESEILAGRREAARDLRRLDLISARTIGESDELCLTAIKSVTPENIRDLRRGECVSQATFAGAFPCS